MKLLNFLFNWTTEIKSALPYPSYFNLCTHTGRSPSQFLQGISLSKSKHSLQSYSVKMLKGGGEKKIILLIYCLLHQINKCNVNNKEKLVLPKSNLESFLKSFNFFRYKLISATFDINWKGTLSVFAIYKRFVKDRFKKIMISCILYKIYHLQIQ